MDSRKRSNIAAMKLSAMSRWKRIGFLTFVIPAAAWILFLCAGYAVFALPCKLEPFTKISRIDVGNDRFVTLSRDACWEIGFTVYYEVSEQGEVIIPRTGLSFITDSTGNFKVAYAENQSLIAVYDFTGDLFAIVDFKTRESWPTKCIEANNCSESKTKALALFMRLQKENPNLERPKTLLQ